MLLAARFQRNPKPPPPARIGFQEVTGCLHFPYSQVSILLFNPLLVIIVLSIHSKFDTCVPNVRRCFAAAVAEVDDEVLPFRFLP